MSPRLFVQVVLIEARSRMSYRVDFWINAFATFAVEIGLAWFLWSAMFRESGHGTIAGYDLHGMLVYYLAVILFGRIVRGPELTGRVSNDIYEGGLNRYLVFPTSYFAFKYAQSLGSLVPALIQLVLLAALFPVLAREGAGVALSPLSAAMALLSLAAANLLYFTMGFPIQCVAFWADNVWSLAVCLRFTCALLGGALLPLAVFPSGLRAVVDVLPFRYLYDAPVGALLGRTSVSAWATGLVLTLGWTLVFALPARAVWRRGSLQYSGIGM